MENEDTYSPDPFDYLGDLDHIKRCLFGTGEMKLDEAMLEDMKSFRSGHPQDKEFIMNSY